MHKLLVANRGEIALRIMRTARTMGLGTVAVYSEADKDAPFVHFADEAYFLGPAPASESYLRGDKILQICAAAGVDALHPGYGFLSENAAFARQVRAAGITFVGPSAEAMDKMGNKLAAKQAVREYGVPLVPGLDTAITDLAEAKAHAAAIGFPVLIKAAAGGGGKGMRVVQQAQEFEQHMKLAQSEALNAFGDGSIFLERYLAAPRHIEIQVLADEQGNMVHLFERECSIQRRHQKLIEEAPSALLSPKLRKAMGKAALSVCKACGYTNAGTVEFLVDEDHNFYFLEMNTRLQVEHPVTELITGLDLVREQLRIADGYALGYSQKDLAIQGHAIEVRVCAEDATQNFLPQAGTLALFNPAQGEGVRVDSGYTQGMEVPIYYDNMLAKLIVHAPTRQEAIAKMRQAVLDFEVLGVPTTLDFARFVMDNEAFKAGQFDTGFIAQHFTPELLQQSLAPDELQAVLAAAWLLHQEDQSIPLPLQPLLAPSLWRLNRLGR